MDKVKFRKRVLDGMVECAETLHEFYNAQALANLVIIDNYHPVTFKASVSDRFLFRKLFDEVEENIRHEFGSGRLMPDLIYVGYQVVIRRYFPIFGFNDEQALRQAKESKDF